VSGIENGAELGEKSDEQSDEWESEKGVEHGAGSGRLQNRNGAVCGLNLPLMATPTCCILFGLQLSSVIKLIYQYQLQKSAKANITIQWHSPVLYCCCLRLRKGIAYS